jgi:Asp/Glu/Hydantoin racemase
LHTAQSNVAIFEAAAAALGFPPGALSHEVRADLLAAAEQAGGLTGDIENETRRALIVLSRNADAAILTCSTLGPVVSTIGDEAFVPVLRVDSALAETAVKSGGKVVALCAVETTMEPTGRLFMEAAKHSQAETRTHLVPGAWAMFKAGDRNGYLLAIAEAVEAAYDDGASVVALAQASMAGAADLVKRGPKPLSSPTIGLAAAFARFSQKS